MLKCKSVPQVSSLRQPNQLSSLQSKRTMSTHSSLGKRMVDKTTDLGKVSLVTGGSSGIGRASCLRLAEEGSRVIVTDIPQLQEQGESLAQYIREHHGEAFFQPLDVRSEDAWKKAIDRAEDSFGPLDVLVNNAGVGGLSPAFEDLSLEEWRKILDVNLDGTFLGSKYAVRSMKHRYNDKRSHDDIHNSASIINMSSILGLVGNPMAPHYSASKGAVRLLTKSLSLYCAQQRDAQLNGQMIRVNSVHPGYVETPILDALDEESKNQLKHLHPMGRIGQPREIGDAVLFLASDESSFVTGTEITVDGGYTAQ
eukprot:gb/GECH01011457.1/.p1 GENE.gb/GECH01011457.1/~~gb/GECH01011457.1/.p1  ORF type:complete len:311 (+),score=77.27 gb/GECH01011457.1/:1-933(+)